MLGSRRGSVALAVLLAIACDSSVSPSGVERVAAIAKVAVTTKALSLVVGQERQLSIAGSGPRVTWESDNAAAVGVSSTGVVSARAPGLAHVVVRQQFAADTTTVTVLGAPVGIQLEADSLNIAVGQSARVSFRAVDAFGTAVDSAGFSSSQIRWSSTLPSIATVDSVGLISAVAVGRCGIVLSVGGKVDTAIVNVVPVAVATVVLSVPAQFSISTGSSYTIIAVAKDALGNELPNRAVTWSSSDVSVATVSQTGVVNGVSPGSAQISASSEGQTSKVGVIVVPAPVVSVTVLLAAAVIDTGRTTQATAVARDAKGDVVTGRSVVWSSDSPNVATVSNVGVVKGIGSGAAGINAVIDGVAASATIKVGSSPVSAPVATIGVSLGAGSLSVGQSTQATATARDAAGNVLTGQTLTWSSSDRSIATVSPSGIVTAVGSGSVYISVQILSVLGSAPLTVNPQAVAPAAGDLPSHDFEDGTLGGFYNPWGTGIDVVSDPTGSGHGNVARVHYAADAVTQYDDNRALFPKTEIAIGLGDSIWFRGDFYLPATVNDDPTTGAIRKLLYWGWTKDQWHFPHEFDMIVTLQGSQVEVTNNAIGPSNLPVDYTYTPTYVTKGRWHTIETQLKVNSNFAAQDGILRIWLDGALIYDRTNMRWTDPLWTDDPSTYKWTSWGVGDQMQAKIAYDEYRYWDNVTFAKSRVQP